MWSDKETVSDYLGFSNYVEVLSEICIQPELAPLTLGVFGSWGSGKTSLMKMIKQHLERDAEEKNVIVLWFNAWRYEGRDEAQSALIHAILSQLQSKRAGLFEESKDLVKKLKNGASVLKLAKFITKTAITLTPDIQGLIDCFSTESEKIAETMEQFEKDFEQLLKKVEVKRVIIFIDDLDRCSSAKVIETFETIKLFLNIPECSFLIGADDIKINEAVGDIYEIETAKRSQFARDYLEKIIQIPFRIPEQGLEDINCYIGMLVFTRYLNDEGRKELLSNRNKIVRQTTSIEEEFLRWGEGNQKYFGGNYSKAIKEFRNIFPNISILAHGLRGNPRQIKRFLNILALRMRLAEANALKLEGKHLVKISVLEYVWEDFFKALVETVNPKDGRSDLIDELLKAGKKPPKEESELVAKFIDAVGLIEFMNSSPKLSSKIDLRPYLFLAQTSITREKDGGLTPLDEKAKVLARRIASQDRLRSQTSARQAAGQEPEVASAIIRLLFRELVGSGDDRVKTHIIKGVHEICLTHESLYQNVLQGLSTLDLGKAHGVAIAATDLILAAEKRGATGTKKLKQKFAKISEIAAALSKE